MSTAGRPQWRTSSYSGNGENCVEVAPWRTSSYSPNGGENCVEVAPVPNRVLVRHSRQPHAGTIEFTISAWAAFVREAVEDQPSVNGIVVVTTIGADTLVRSLLTDVELCFDEGEWSAFVAGARDGEFDFAIALAPHA
jgi:hypothetical protein